MIPLCGYFFDIDNFALKKNYENNQNKTGMAVDSQFIMRVSNEIAKSGYRKVR
jgi:hypothetical protein